MKKIVELITQILYNNDEGIKQKLNNVINLNKLPDNSYEQYMLIYNLMKDIKKIHNSLINDEDENYKFLITHLHFTFNHFKTLIFNSSDLN